MGKGNWDNRLVAAPLSQVEYGNIRYMNDMPYGIGCPMAGCLQMRSRYVRKKAVSGGLDYCLGKPGMPWVSAQQRPRIAISSRIAMSSEAAGREVEWFTHVYVNHFHMISYHLKNNDFTRGPVHTVSCNLPRLWATRCEDWDQVICACMNHL